MKNLKTLNEAYENKNMRYKNSMGGFTKSPIFKIVLAIMPFGLIIGIVIYFGKPLKEFISNIFGSLKKVTDFAGLSQSQDSVALDAEIAKSNSPFSPNYYKALQAKFNIRLITHESADNFAKQLYDSFAFWTTSDFSKAMSAFKQCNYRTQVSFVCDRFYALYNKDFLTYTKGTITHLGFSSEQVNEMINYVNSLPVGTY